MGIAEYEANAGKYVIAVMMSHASAQGSVSNLIWYQDVGEAQSGTVSFDVSASTAPSMEQGSTFGCWMGTMRTRRGPPSSPSRAALSRQAMGRPKWIDVCCFLEKYCGWIVHPRNNKTTVQCKKKKKKKPPLKKKKKKKKKKKS